MFCDFTAKIVFDLANHGKRCIEDLRSATLKFYEAKVQMSCVETV